jgi:UDP-N-acetylmuramoylalanine--D-glutamate ligase
MIEKLIEFLKDKNIIILGFGMEGETTYDFIRNHLPTQHLTIADMNEVIIEDYPYLKQDQNLELILGKNYLNNLENYDLIIKTPGLSLKDIDISKYEHKITNQLELVMEFLNVFSIGITGTKGKSTTSTLMYNVLKDQGKNVMLLGNIGEPIFHRIDEMAEDTILVLEMSSHALEFVKRSPNISILLNTYEEHLDHYVSLEKYIEAKFNIAKYQRENDTFIYNYDNALMNEFGYSHRENDYAVSIFDTPNTKNKTYIKNENIYMNDEILCSKNINMNLKGIHNLNNIMFILTAVKLLSLDISKALETIANFQPLEHRMEYVATINGVSYYNDSIATIPEATINGIKAIGNINTLIVGGKDRGVNLEELIEFLAESDIENIICLHTTGEYIYSKLEKTDKNLFKVNNMESAVKIAKKVTSENTNCLLSPAAASYGFFKNFKERGEIFKKCVLSNE